MWFRVPKSSFMTGGILSVRLFVFFYLDYQERCEAVRRVLSSDSEFFIHESSFGGGLGHKYLSLQYSLSCALVLGRRYERWIIPLLLSSLSTNRVLEQYRFLLTTLFQSE